MERTVLDCGKLVELKAEGDRFLTTEAFRNFGKMMLVSIDREGTIIEVCHDKKQIIKRETSPPVESNRDEELTDIMNMIQALERKVQEMKNEQRN